MKKLNIILVLIVLSIVNLTAETPIGNFEMFDTNSNDIKEGLAYYTKQGIDFRMAFEIKEDIAYYDFVVYYNENTYNIFDIQDEGVVSVKDGKLYIDNGLFYKEGDIYIYKSGDVIMKFKKMPDNYKAKQNRLPAALMTKLHVLDMYNY